MIDIACNPSQVEQPGKGSVDNESVAFASIRCLDATGA